MRARTRVRRLARPEPRAEATTRPAATSLSRIRGRPRASTVALRSPVPVLSTMLRLPRLASLPLTTFGPGRPRASPASLLPSLAGTDGSQCRSECVQGRVGVDPAGGDAGDRNGARLDRLLDLGRRRTRHEREGERGNPTHDGGGRRRAEKRDVAAPKPRGRVLARSGDVGARVREPVKPIVLVGGRDAEHVREHGRIVRRRAALVAGRGDDEDAVKPRVLCGGGQRQVVDRRAETGVDHAGAVVGRPDDSLCQT
jgi:hypothetical protein